MRHLARHLVIVLAPVLAAVLAAVWMASAALAEPVHGIAMHGSPKYGPGFTHFDYVNPDAPKGGELRLAAVGGSFDTLNPFTLKGTPAALASLPFETLLASSADEPFSEYGLLAESLETPPDRSWVIFTLRPQARWHDGTPITARDVAFSLDILRAKGAPQYRFYYASVASVDILGPRKIKVTFQPGDNRELPLIMGQLPILPEHYWKDRDFAATTLTPPLGSGPYRVKSFEPGRFIEVERVKDYWGRDLPVERGHNNFDIIHSDYYRDSTVALEAFKAGEYDWRSENEAKKWATGYSDWKALSDGRGRREVFDNDRPTGMQGFAMNLRRPLFQDARVRRALALAFDFEWTNKTLFYGQYRRTESYFSNSELAASGLPSPEELKILEPLRDRIPPEVFSRPYHAPATDGSGNIRPNLRAAMTLLEQAGWRVIDGRLVKDGQPFRFEILNNSPAWERICLPFIRNLSRLGIDANIRTVDSAQYRQRMDTYDYDMTVEVWGQSNSPGNEQREFWGSAAADEPGSRNTLGIKDPAIDALIDQVIAAPDRQSLVTRTRALDRVLLAHDFVIPNWHIGVDRVAFWDKFGFPSVTPAQGVQIMTWWIDPAKAARN